MQRVRLTSNEVEALKNSFSKNFLPRDKLWLFGSRVYLEKKGGDIDLYIETEAKTIDEAIEMEKNFLWDLEIAIGEQKIDVVMNMLNFPYPLSIHELAKKEGVRLK